jgi:hypothetical protein
MVAALVRRTLLRSSKLVPIARLLLIGELAVQAGRHVARLDPTERARLLALLRKARHPSALAQSERDELARLVARMEPQAFLGSAVKRLSPVPVPRRVIEGGAGALGRAALRRNWRRGSRAAL